MTPWLKTPAYDKVHHLDNAVDGDGEEIEPLEDEVTDALDVVDEVVETDALDEDVETVDDDDLEEVLEDVDEPPDNNLDNEEVVDAFDKRQVTRRRSLRRFLRGS